MQRTARIGLGVAGSVTFALAFAPLAAAVDEESEATTPAVTTQQQAPFLDLMYASPYKDLELGDTTTVVIAQTLPASYTLESYMSSGGKCFAPYEGPAASTTKSGGESDADKIVRTIVSSGVDANNDGIDDHYANTYDENGIAACKIKVTDEFGNMDWKYIYINVGLPKTAVGDDFVGEVTPSTIATTTTVATRAVSATTVAATPTTLAPTASVAGNSVTAQATLPRTGSSPWLQVVLGSVLAFAGAAMVLVSRRRGGPEVGHTFEF